MQSWQGVEEALAQVQEDGTAGFSACEVRLELRQVLVVVVETYSGTEVQVEAWGGGAKIPDRKNN